MCKLVCARVSALFLLFKVNRCTHCFCVSIVWRLLVCVLVGVCVASVFHPTSSGSVLCCCSEGQRWHWEKGQSFLPPLHLHLSASLHLPISPSLLSCILISLFCGSWYVDFIKFSSGWVTEKTGGDQGSHPLFAAFICPSSFILTRGLWL